MAITVLSTYDDMAEIVPVPQDGFMVIWARVFFSYTLLKLANVPCRYRIFSFYGENKKPRCEICGKPEQEPPPLPEWLQIPYLVPVKGYSMEIIPDSCVNPTTRNGDRLYDQAERTVGTLGAVMTSSRPGKADAYIVLTAGHVIPDGDDCLLVKHRQLDSFTSLEIAPQFRRFDNRPVYRQKEAPSFLDDVGILFVDNDDVKFFFPVASQISTSIISARKTARYLPSK